MHRKFASVTFVVLAGAVGVVGFGAGGCAPKKEPTRTANVAPNPPSPVMGDPDSRVAALGQHATDLQQLARQLPGHTPQDDRKLVAQAFDASSGALELLGGPNPGGAFRQQVRIVDNTRNFLRNGDATVSLEPSIDTGLRSLQDALMNVRERLFPDDPKVRQQLDTLAQHISELDSVRGPTHSLVVAQSFDAAAAAIATMTNELQSRNVATAQEQQSYAAPAAAAAPPAAQPVPPAPAVPVPNAARPAPAAPPQSTVPPPAAPRAQAAPAAPAPR